jgi:hypothetical protein
MFKRTLVIYSTKMKPEVAQILVPGAMDEQVLMFPFHHYMFHTDCVMPQAGILTRS